MAREAGQIAGVSLQRTGHDAVAVVEDIFILTFCADIVCRASEASFRAFETSTTDRIRVVFFSTVPGAHSSVVIQIVSILTFVAVERGEAIVAVLCAGLAYTIEREGFIWTVQDALIEIKGEGDGAFEAE